MTVSSLFVVASSTHMANAGHVDILRPFIRKLEKAVAVSGVFAGVLQESSGKVPGKLLEIFSRIAKCNKF